LAIEILGLLKRCLGQQAAVKSKLYEGLSKLARKSCLPSNEIFLVQLHESILQLFQIPLLKFYEPDVNCFPLKTQETAGDVNNLEPIHHLLFYCAECTIHLAHESQSPTTKQITQTLNSISERASEMEFDRTTLPVLDSSDQDSVASTLFYQIIGTYEALIDYSVRSKVGAEQILKLFGKLHDFQKETKTNGNKPKSKKKKAADNPDSDDGNDNIDKSQKKKVGFGKPKKSKESEPLLSLESCISLMNMMCGNNNDTPLRSTTEFAQYVTQTCKRHLEHILKTVDTIPTGDLESSSEISEHLQACFRLGKLCFAEFTTNWTEPNQGTNENAFPIGALGCLEIVVKIVACVGTGKQFLELVKVITPESDEPGPLNDNQLIHSCLDTFQYLLLQLVEHGSKTATESELMINIIIAIFNKVMELFFETQEFESQQNLVSKMTKWIHELFKQSIQNPSLAKSVVGLFLDHGSDTKHSHQLILEFLEEIRSVQLSLKTNQNHESKWKIINEKTINPIVSVIISRLDAKLSQCEWAFINLKETFSLMEKPQASKEDSMAEELSSSHSQIMSSVYTEMENTLALCFVLGQLVVSGAVIDSLIKLFTKLYNILNKSTKDLLDAKAVPSLKYRELVDYSGSKLSPQISAYLQSIEQNQKGSSDAKLQKESRAIPNLVFSIEKYEISLIKLCKQSKLPLMKNFHRSTARDFRLDLKAVQSKQPEATEKQKRGTTNGKSPKAKKQKVAVKEERDG